MAAKPPIFQIDLDSPPEARYQDVVEHFRDPLHGYVILFEDVTESMPASKFIRFISRYALRGVYNKEEDAEIKGIAKLSGLPIHLVVALNAFLDILCACTSGGVAMDQDSQGNSIPEGQKTMYHFRTLDWYMEEMRSLVYEAHYIRNGKVVAQALTYAGYTGVLTGVRPGLSISLNHRSAYNACSHWQSLKHISHRIMVLLGMRPSIATHLRSLLLDDKRPLSLGRIAARFPNIPTTACFLFFCDGIDMLHMEKDHVDAKIQTTVTDGSNGGNYLLGTNHDCEMEQWSTNHFQDWEQRKLWFAPDGMKGIVDESFERKTCLDKKLRKRYPPVTGENGRESIDIDSQSIASTIGSTKRRSKRIADQSVRSRQVTLLNLSEWLQDFPTKNEVTHFSCIMDANQGAIVWREWYF